jgi:hypothetical protein
MIICHCQSITDRDVHAAIDWMRAADVDTIITPGKIYRALATHSMRIWPPDRKPVKTAARSATTGR